jgi:hypothetical protein
MLEYSLDKYELSDEQLAELRRHHRLLQTALAKTAEEILVNRAKIVVDKADKEFVAQVQEKTADKTTKDMTSLAALSAVIAEIKKEAKAEKETIAKTPEHFQTIAAMEIIAKAENHDFDADKRPKFIGGMIGGVQINDVSINIGKNSVFADGPSSDKAIQEETALGEALDTLIPAFKEQGVAAFKRFEDIVPFDAPYLGTRLCGMLNIDAYATIR